MTKPQMGATPREEKLRNLLSNFVVGELAERRRLLETETGLLLSSRAESMLRESAAAAAQCGEEEGSAILSVTANFLAACRFLGWTKVWDDTFAVPKITPDPGNPTTWYQELETLDVAGGEWQKRTVLERKLQLCRLLLHIHPRKAEKRLRAIIRCRMGNTLTALGEQTGDVELLKSASRAFHTALKELPRRHNASDWATTQDNLGNALSSLGAMMGDASVLKKAEQAYLYALKERKLERCPTDWATTQSHLGSLLASLGELTADTITLHRAEEACNAALRVFSQRSAPLDWAATQNNLGIVLSILGSLTGDLEVLHGAELAFRAALDVFTPDCSPMDCAMAQHNLGIALLDLGFLAGDEAMLQSSEQCFLAALQVRKVDVVDLDWATTTRHLARAIFLQGDLVGNADLIRRAEQTCLATLRVLDRKKSPADWGKAQAVLGEVLLRRYELTGIVNLLRQSERACLSAIEVFTPTDAPLTWARVQLGLGNVLSRVGSLTADVSMLHQAEKSYTASLEVLTWERSRWGWATTQANLANVLLQLGTLTGDPEVLRRSEEANRAASKRFEDGATATFRYARAMNNLGVALQARGEITSDVDILIEAERVHRDALKALSRERTATDWALTQNNLGCVSRLLGTLTRDVELLRRAELFHSNALDVFTREQAAANWSSTYNHLGNVFSSIGAISDEELATGAFLRAEKAYLTALLELNFDQTPIQWAKLQFNLGTTLTRLWVITRDKVVQQRAEAAFRSALGVMEQSAAEDNLQSLALGLVRLLVQLGRYESAVEVILPALSRSEAALLDAARSPDGGMRAVEQTGELFGLLSLCKLRQQASDPREALLATERGRARLVSRLIRLDTLRSLTTIGPEPSAAIVAMRDRRDLLRQELGYDLAAEPSAHLTGSRDLSPQLRQQLQGELRQATDAYVALCQKHGLLHTSETVGLAEIMAAAPVGGALVIPVLTSIEAFAFIVARDTEPFVIELPGLDRTIVATHLDRENYRLDAGGDSWIGAYHAYFKGPQRETPATEARWLQQLTSTLTWLWERLLAPLDRSLRFSTRLSPGAPVVLLPPGLLGLLPLHAAGPGPDGLYFGDHWTVSYAPSVHTLLTCYQRAEHYQNLAPKLLAVIDPDPNRNLPAAAHEAALLRDRFAQDDPDPRILNKDATLAKVLQYLPEATCFHASTHCDHDPLWPNRSALTLADGDLRLDILSEARLASLRLVFLAGCESGLAEVRRFPEEFVGLPTALLGAGAACVVASRWPVEDISTCLLVGRFYELLIGSIGGVGLAPAAALRGAQIWLRSIRLIEIRQMFPRDLTDIELPLGEDQEQPYSDPFYWASFACHGA